MISYNNLYYVRRLNYHHQCQIYAYDDKAQSMRADVFPYIDRDKTIPVIENRGRSDISLKKIKRRLGKLLSKFNFPCKEAGIEYGTLYLHKCNPNAKMRSVGATYPCAAMTLQLTRAKWHFWTFTSFLFFSLQEMFYICGILQESMSGVILMGEFKIWRFAYRSCSLFTCSLQQRSNACACANAETINELPVIGSLRLRTISEIATGQSLQLIGRNDMVQGCSDV